MLGDSDKINQSDPQKMTYEAQNVRVLHININNSLSYRSTN